MKSPLKILLIIEACLAGVGRHVTELCRGLAQRGHSVHLIYSPSRIDALFQKGLADLREFPITIIPLPMTRSPHPRDAFDALTIRRYIKEHGPFDVIHGHSSKGGALARLSGIGLPGVRVYTPHALFTMNPELSPLPRWVYARIEQFLNYLSDGIILVSEDEHRHAIEIGLSPRRLFVVPNGIDHTAMPRSSRLRQNLDLSQTDLCIGCVARFVPQKALEHLLQAFALLAPKFPNARLIMVGNGPLEADLHATAERLGIQARVSWPGAFDGVEAMAAFDIFALPSRYESFPYVLLEAMAAGLPVVMTRVGGSGSLIVDGVNGLVVPIAQPDLLASALESLLENPELRRRMSEEACERIKDYSLEGTLAKTLDVYEALLTRTRQVPGEMNSSNPQ